MGVSWATVGTLGNLILTKGALGCRFFPKNFTDVPIQSQEQGVTIPIFSKSK